MEIFEFLAQQSAAPTLPAAPNQPAQPGGMASWTALLPLAILPLMWFFMIRPQRKEEKRKKELLSQIKKGDEVVTSAGMIGTVATIKDDTIILNVGDKTRLEFLKSHITSVREVKKTESK